MATSIDSETLIAGLQRAVERQPEARVLTAWLSLANGALTFQEHYQKALQQRELTYLTLDTTGACDLTCHGMCYYHPDIRLRDPQVPEGKLLAAIESAINNLALQNLTVVGKEPFLNPARLFGILEFAGGRKTSQLSIGIVSNGRNCSRHWDRLEQCSASGALDFFDISLDSGFAEQHDAMRGVPGTFDLAFQAVAQSVRRLPSTRVGITSVIRNDNQPGLLELLRSGAHGGVRYFCFVPIQPPPFTTTPSLHATDLVEFFVAVSEVLGRELAGAGIEVIASLNGISLLECEQHGFFSWADFRENREGQIYTSCDIAGNNLVFNFAVLPDYGDRLARITYNGSYLAHAHFLQTPDPDKYAVGNINDEPITALFERGKRLHFRDVIQSRRHHMCQRRPCWNNCFGGWTIAEHAFLTGQALESQPALCTKRESDFGVLEDRWRQSAAL